MELLAAHAFRGVVRNGFGSVGARGRLPTEPQHLFLEAVTPLLVELVIWALHFQTFEIGKLKLSSGFKQGLLHHEM